MFGCHTTLYFTFSKRRFVDLFVLRDDSASLSDPLAGASFLNQCDGRGPGAAGTGRQTKNGRFDQVGSPGGRGPVRGPSEVLPSDLESAHRLRPVFGKSQESRGRSLLSPLEDFSRGSKGAWIEMRPAGLLAAVVIPFGMLPSIRFSPYASAVCVCVAVLVCCKSFKAAVVPKEAPPPVSRMLRGLAAHMHRAHLDKLA